VVLRATRHGLAIALRHKRLAVLLWLCGLAIAAAAGVPAWLALAAAIGPLPHADVLADGLSLGVLADLVEMRPGLIQGLLLAALGALGLGVLAGAFATGGVLEVLSSGDERPLAHRFGRGAFRFFGRFLRAGVLAVVFAVLLGGLLAAPFAALSRRAAEAAWEPARFANAGAGAALAFLGVLVALLALDATRMQVVRDDARRVVPAFARGVRAVLRHPLQWLGTWAVNALLVGAALAVYVGLRERLPAAAPLALVVALQQAFVLTRCLFRTALLGSEMALVERHLPRAARAPVPAPVPSAQPPAGFAEPVGPVDGAESAAVTVPAAVAAAVAEPVAVGVAMAEPVAVGVAMAEPASGPDENRPR